MAPDKNREKTEEHSKIVLHINTFNETQTALRDLTSKAKDVAWYSRNANSEEDKVKLLEATEKFLAAEEEWQRWNYALQTELTRITVASGDIVWGSSDE